MRNGMIFGTVAALLGLATVAQATDQPRSVGQDGTQVTREAAGDSGQGKQTRAAASDSRGDRDERYERSKRSRDHHDGRERHEAREGHDEAGEHAERR